ncbi:glycosyltransferase [Aureimonas psammosilenae]|uniref:glycosyltransferase n=1 Tax=Aureimonas psammosilenae TaxID=2495496 RepID=UPI001260A076|nr:glycosyltransferase [Aureimonas psammosilenae]
MNPSQFLAYPVVAVPARDEEERLPRLLEALDAQTWACEGHRLTVVLVLNNCVDATRRVAEEAGRHLSGLQLDILDVNFAPPDAHVGSARRLAMDRAFAHFPDPASGVILTTDADAVPEPGWLEANLRAVGNGADLVGGKLFGNKQEEARLGPGFAERAKAVLTYSSLCDRLACLIDEQAHDPWPRHRDHTGGSLAIAAALYRRIGGLPVLPSREDLALVSKARAAGGRLVHPLDVRVEVSARLVGRAPGGMADCLKDWLRAEAEGLPLLVEDPAAVEERLLRRRTLRQLDQAGASERAAIAQSLGVPAPALLDADGERLTAAALIEIFAPDEPDALPTVPVALATMRIEQMIAIHEATPRAA